LNKQKAVVVMVGLALALSIIALVVAGLWALTGAVSETTLRAWALAVSALVLPAFGFGFYLGKVEARGMLAGLDKSLDRMTGVVEKIVSVRDTSRITVHQATRPAVYTVPMARPAVNHRFPSGCDVVDL
jgi:hypothetical protein